MRARNDPQLFAGMRKSRIRGVGLKGDLDGFRAARHVWTCASCLAETRVNPYRKPYTRANPQACKACNAKAWAHSDSQSEANRYVELKRRRDVAGLKHPPEPLAIRSFTQTGDIVVVRQYRADFVYTETHHNQRKVVEDHKPHNRLTELQKLIHTLVWHQHGIDVLITWYTGKGRTRRIHQDWASNLR